ncbi:hypothetical protein [Microcystis sp. LE18-22.4A]|nr:hypothetical protein [Microcystis sp. LE18-22.4A]
MSVGALIEFYFKLIICITIPEEPPIFSHYLTLLAPNPTKCREDNPSL